MPLSYYQMIKVLHKFVRSLVTAEAVEVQPQGFRHGLSVSANQTEGLVDCKSRWPTELERLGGLRQHVHSPMNHIELLLKENKKHNTYTICDSTYPDSPLYFL